MGNSVTPIGSGICGSGGNKTDPITRLTAARWQGEQALYTEAVAMLTERPALPDDLAGLVAQLAEMAEALREAGEALAWSSRRMVGADSNAALLASTKAFRCARSLITDDARAALDRIKADVRAEGMREAADICIGETLIVAPESVGQYAALDSYRAQIRSSILAAIPEVRK